jgi:hypothetical protein
MNCLPWIENRTIRRFEVANVTRDDREAILDGGCCNRQLVSDRPQGRFRSQGGPKTIPRVNDGGEPFSRTRGRNVDDGFAAAFDALGFASKRAVDKRAYGPY